MDSSASFAAPPVAPSALDRLRGGLPHRSTDPGLILLRHRARALAAEYSATPADQMTARLRALASLFGTVGHNVEIDAPLFCEYGQHIFVGDDFVAGPNCVFTDVGRILIGDRVRLGPSVHLYAVARPFDAEQRAEGLEQAAPITIGSDVWIGGRTIVNPGITIGSGTTVGPGSVVLQDLPPNVFASGNPCQVVRELSAVPAG